MTSCLLLLETPWPQSLEYTSLVGVLLAGVVVLWRAYQAKQRELEAAMKQLAEESKAIEEVPEALDRLRVEVLGRLDGLDCLRQR